MKKTAKAIAAVLAAVPFAVLADDARVTAAVAEDCAGMGTVAALDRTVAAGTKVAIKATAANGYYFAGWYINGAPAETASDYRTASNTYSPTGGVAALEARFTTAAEDYIDFEFPSDLEMLEYETEEPLDIAFQVDSETLPVLSVSGLPAGLKLDAQNFKITGKPSREGVYYVTATAKNASGYQYSKTVACTVGSPDEPEESDFAAYADFSGIAELMVGEPVGYESDLEGAPCIGTYYADSKEGVSSVSGLPAGLKAVKATDPETGDAEYYAVGTPTKPGVYTVTLRGRYLNDNDVLANGTASAKVIVETFPSVYFDVSAGEGGTASGTKVYAAGATASITAKAASGYVFAGWTELPEDEEFAYLESYDWRTPALKIPVVLDAQTTWHANFVSKEDDALVEIESEDVGEGETVEFDPVGAAENGDALSLYFEVASLSLPTVNVSGLPAGFTFSSIPSDGGYAIEYDPETASKTPAPGVYTVKLAAKNASGATGELEFAVKIANISSEYISVPDDLGSYAPGVEIGGEDVPAIDLSGAVDFGAGTVLTVSGLPTGLKYNAADKTVTGVPTAPGFYTVKFTAKIRTCAETSSGGQSCSYTTEEATATIEIEPFPELAVEVDEEAADAGCTVSGAGRFAAGSKKTLKATAAKGWVFAGWEGDGDMTWLESLNPSLAYTTTFDDAGFTAMFVPVSDDYLWINEPEDGGFVFALKEEVDEEAILSLVESVSLPSLAVSGLPAGVKFTPKTALLSGAPTKAGIYYATVSAKNAGGYAHSRIIRITVTDAEGNAPEEAEEQNDADIDFGIFEESPLVSGGALSLDGELSDYVFDVWEHPETGAGVVKIAVSGLPAGLKAATAVEDGVGAFMLYGTPSKPGRYKLTVTVTYDDRKTAKSVKTYTVLDGGSVYVEVASEDETLGTATGSGVYAAGAKIALKATAKKGNVFAGWCELLGEDPEPFYALPVYDGVDYRTAQVSATVRPEMLPEDGMIRALFVPSESDDTVSIVFDEDSGDGMFEIGELDEDWLTTFTVESASLPKLTVKGLPRGFWVDAANGLLGYDSANAATVAPGVYSVALSAVNVSNARADKTITIIVPNKTSDAIFSDPGIDAYPLTAGMAIGTAFEDVRAVEGYTLSVSGLPAGVTYRNGTFSGVPTKAGVYTVTLTAKAAGEPVETATITVSVEALPEWARGTFNGRFEGDGAGGVYQPGTLTATISANGALSGKITILAGGTTKKTYSFKAASISEREDREDSAMFVYRGVSIPLPEGTATADVFVTATAFDETGPLSGIVLLEFVEYPAEEVKYSGIAFLDTWTGDFEAPVFNGRPVVSIEPTEALPFPESLSAAGVTKLDVTFGAKGAASVKVWKGKTAVETVSGALVVRGVYGGAFDTELYFVLPKTKTGGAISFELVPGEDGKVSADGISAVVFAF